MKAKTRKLARISFVGGEHLTLGEEGPRIVDLRTVDRTGQLNIFFEDKHTVIANKNTWLCVEIQDAEDGGEEDGNE